MRIAIDYTPAIAQIAGIGRYARELVAGLATIDTQNTYTLFSATPASTTSAPTPEAENMHLSVVPIGERTLTRLWHRLRFPLPVDLLTGPAEIFHALDFALPPAITMRRVVTIHDLAFLTHPECAVPSLASYLTTAVRRAVQDAEAIITISEHTRRVLIERVPGVDPRRVTTIPLGVGDEFRPSKAVERIRLNSERWGVTHPLVLAVGTLEPRKNYPQLIRAFAQARRMPGGPQRLIIAGRLGWRYEPIFATIEELGLRDVVTVTGAIDDADLMSLYTLADVVAQVSITEGFGLPVLEAMRCGVPVVASSAGALPEVAGDAAIMVDSWETAAIADALHRAVTDESLRQSLSRQGREQAARFSWRDTAVQTLQVYRRVAA